MLFNAISLLFNGYGDPQDGDFRRGRLQMDEAGENAEFYADKPRNRKNRNKRIFRDERTLLMRTCDGRYLLHLTFDWQGEETWRVLTGMLKDAFQELKSYIHKTLR